jgi:hypothetical protein
MVFRKNPTPETHISDMALMAATCWREASLEASVAAVTDSLPFNGNAIDGT